MSKLYAQSQTLQEESVTKCALLQTNNLRGLALITVGDRHPRQIRRKVDRFFNSLPVSTV